MEIGGHDDPVPRAGVDIDVGIHAALADQPQRREPLDQRAGDRGSFSDEDDRVKRSEPLCQSLDRPDVVREHGHVMGGEFGVARQRAQCVEVIVEDCDLHGEQCDGRAVGSTRTM